MPEQTTDKDEVLRKIGRNVVVLQKLEGLLKKLVTIQGATVSATDQETFLQKAEKISKKPLGHLVSEFLRSAYSSGAVSDPIEGADLNATVSLSFTLDPEMENEHAESLSSVVKERNALIHQMLVSLDPNSSASRENLGRKLDEQLDRILPEYQLLHSLLAGIKESLEMAESELDAGKQRGHD
jgi:hypothetical protein